MIDVKVAGKVYTPKQINSVPSQFKKWIEGNKERIDKANARGTLPYWLNDNQKFAGIKTAEMQQIKKTVTEYKNGGRIDIYQTVDKMVGEKFYEYEGFDINKNTNPIRTFKNMISRGLVQSDCIVIDDCGIGRSWAQRYIYDRVIKGVDIKEVWVFELTRDLTRLF